MNATSISPTHRPNLCACGHDYLAHTIGGTGGGNCRLCLPTGNQQHPFTSVNELASLAFTQRDLSRTIAAGGFGTIVTATQQNATVGIGATSMTINAPSGPVLAGMSFTLQASGNPVNTQTYRVVNVAGNVITFTPPARIATNLNSLLRFSGTFGSTLGGGRPPNGQRAG